MKKFGQFMFTVVPVLLVIVIENLASFFLLGIAALADTVYLAAKGSLSFSWVMRDIAKLLTNTNFGACLMIIYALISISFFGLWYYVKYGGSFRLNAKETFRPLSVLGIVMLVPGTQYLTTYLVTFLSLIFPGWLKTYEDLLESAGMDNTLTLSMLLYSVLLAPAAEEIICRGVMLGQAKKVLPFWPANLLQAFLFGVLHMNMLQGSYAFCLGLILGFLYEKSGSIYIPILFHVLFNFCGTVLSEYLPFGDGAFSFLFWFLFGLAMTIGGIAVFLKGSQRTAKTAEHS